MISLAVLQAFAYRFEAYSSDDCAYLDQAVFFSRFDWSNAITGYWSPLYPFLLGMMFKVFNPALSDQLLAARFLNVVILVGLLFSFDFFLKQFISVYNERMDRQSTERLRLTAQQWLSIGGCLFAWLFFSVGAVNQTTPDFLVAISMFLAAAMALQISKSPALWRFALLGFVLGLGYLSKASMIPAAVTLITLAAFQSIDVKAAIALPKRLCGMAIAFAVLIAVSCPYVAALTEKRGHFEIGSSAGLNYMMSIACRYRPLGPNNSELIKDCPHPIQTLSEQPNLAAFDSPLDVTFAPWFDPSYFAEGLPVVIDPIASVVSMLTNMLSLFALFGWQIALVFLTGLQLTRRLVVQTADVRVFAVLWLPAAVTMLGICCVINLTIGWTTQRYFPSLVLLLYLVYFAICNFTNDEKGKKALKLSVGIVCGAALVLLGSRVVADLGRLYQQSNKSMQVATSLLSSGLHAGDKVAMIGDEGVDWARLANLKIVAHVRSNDNKNDLNSEDSVNALMDKLRQTKACAVVYFAEPFSDYVNDEAQRAQTFRDTVSKLTGGKPIQHVQLQIPASCLTEWKKLDGANAYYRKL